MKIRIFALFLALLSLPFCMTSCNKDSNNENLEFVRSESTLLYNNLLYRKGEVNNGSDNVLDKIFTLTYTNLENVQKVSLPIYNDVLAEGEDPFQRPHGGTVSYQMILDKQATQKNGGMPVLLVGYTYESGFIYEYDKKEYYTKERIVSFNTATNRITEIVGDSETECFYLYGDTIYYMRYLDKDSYYTDGQKGSDGGRVFYTVSKKGGKPKRHNLPDKDVGYDLLAVFEGKLYFIDSLNRLYRSSLDFKNAELLCEDLPAGRGSEYMQLMIRDGYLYYSKNQETTTIEDIDIKHYDICRRPLEDLSSETEETVLDHVVGVGNREGSKIYYISLDDAQIVQTFDGVRVINSGAVWRSYDITTNEDKIVVDYRKIQKPVVGIWISEKYFVYLIVGEEWNWTLVNLETGKEAPYPNYI